MKTSRAIVSAALLAFAASCAGLREVPRGDYQRVYASADVAPSPGAPQDVITRDVWEAELAQSVVRTWQPPTGWAPASLEDEPRLSLAVGDIVELVVNESDEPELWLGGSAVEAFWGPPQKRDLWEDGADVTVRRSTLWLRGRKPGQSTLRYRHGEATMDIAITVTP